MSHDITKKEFLDLVPTIERYRERISNSHSRFPRVIAICLGRNRSSKEVQSLQNVNSTSKFNETVRRDAMQHLINTLS